jgi:hypothetical protein
MSRPSSYFDVAGAAIGGGYRVIYIHDRRQRQAIIETANDVAAAARLCGVRVLSDAPDIRAACLQYGVGLIVEERAP